MIEWEAIVGRKKWCESRRNCAPAAGKPIWSETTGYYSSTTESHRADFARALSRALSPRLPRAKSNKEPKKKKKKKKHPQLNRGPGPINNKQTCRLASRKRLLPCPGEQNCFPRLPGTASFDDPDPVRILHPRTTPQKMPRNMFLCLEFVHGPATTSSATAQCPLPLSNSLLPIGLLVPLFLWKYARPDALPPRQSLLSVLCINTTLYSVRLRSTETMYSVKTMYRPCNRDTVQKMQQSPCAESMARNTGTSVAKSLSVLVTAMYSVPLGWPGLSGNRPPPRHPQLLG
jgi:hypothetical protein